MAHKVVYTIVMGAAVLVAITGIPDEAQSHTTTPAHAIVHIENEVDKNADRMDNEAVSFAVDVEGASSVAEAQAMRAEAAEGVGSFLTIGQRNIERYRDDFPDNEDVQQAYEDAHAGLHDAAEAATDDINATYAFWLSQNGSGTSTTTSLPPTTLPPPTTTTTKPVPTTTTKPPPATTTTTIRRTTTTTAPPAPTTPPPTPATTSTTATSSTTTTTVLGGASGSGSGGNPFTPDMPLAVVLGESLEPIDNGNREVQSIELVRRLVDTQLPSGVSQVAVSPLLVLELILNAILAAGSLMLLPWVALMAYAIYLARDMRVKALSVDPALEPTP